MGVKSKIRSMQRGALKRGDAKRDDTPDYANFDPILTRAEELHFGSEGVQRDSFLAPLDREVLGFVKGGFGRPTDLSRLLNKSGRRTFRGERWTPRLC